MASSYHFAYAWLGGAELTSDVTIGVDGGEIVSVSEDLVNDSTYVDGVALPGMVSAHSHAFHRALRGRTHDGPGDFWAWRQPMYELANTLDPDSYFVLATDVFSEMLSSGITTVGEFHYVHHRPDGTTYEDPNAMGHAILAAAEQAGIRITLLDTLYLTSRVDGSPPLAEQRRFSDGSADAWIDRFTALETGANAKVGVAAHSVRSVPTHALTRVASVAEEQDCLVHVHAAEQIAENEACFAAHGKHPIELLADTGMLTSRATLIHGTHVSDRHISLVADSGAMVCFCPTTEADLGDGIGPALEYVEAGVPLCLGSDSNATIDPLVELRQLENHDRLRLRRRGVHSPASLLAMSTQNGGRSLGWKTGRLEEGWLADIIVVDPPEFDAQHGLGQITMTTDHHHVTHVMVGGRMVL